MKPEIARVDAAVPLVDASLPPPTPDDVAAWLAAPSFSVELSGSSCYGSCPTFSVRIDQNGHVGFLGVDWVARPGYYELDVPAARARALYDAMIEAGFLRLRDRYAEAADGCVELFTDAPTYTFALRAGDRTKRVEIYGGCRSSASRFRERFEPEIRRATNAGIFLYPTPPFRSCPAPEDFPDVEFEQSWVLEDLEEGVQHGILQLEGKIGVGRWTVSSCDGTELASGDFSRGARSDDERLLVPAAENPSTFTWPGLDEPQSVALLARTSLPSIAITLLTLTEQHRQWGRPGAACAQR